MKHIILSLVILLFNAPSTFAQTKQDLPTPFCALVFSICGYLNVDGNWAIYPKFAAVEKFSTNGLASARDGSLFGYIDHYGKWAVKPSFTLARPFSNNGLAAVRNAENKYGYISAKGEMVIGFKFDNAYPFTESGLASAKMNGRYGVIDRRGDWVLENRYDNIRITGNGVILATLNGLDGIMDINGDWIKEPSFNKISSKWPDFSKMLTAQTGDLFGFIDLEGHWKIEPIFQHARSFGKNEIASVEVNGRWGAVDYDGRWIVRPIYEALLIFDEFIAYKYQGRWGYLNHDGSFHIEARFERVFQFDERGLAAVQLDEKWGFINTKGDWSIRPSFHEVHGFRGKNWTIVQDAKGRNGVINRSGSWIHRPWTEEKIKEALLTDGSPSAMLSRARQIVEATPNTAFVLASAAANEGSVEAQNYLGWMLSSGTGVGRDDSEAYYWFRRSADQGSQSAQYNVGLMFAYGRGVTQDTTKAQIWLNAAKGSGFSKEKVGKILKYLDELEASKKVTTQPLRTPSDSVGACSRSLKLTFDMAAGVDQNPRLSVNGPSSVNIYADGSYADITARGNNCVNGQYSFNYAVEYNHLVDGIVPYNYNGSFNVGSNTQSCYITLSRSGGSPSINCN